MRNAGRTKKHWQRARQRSHGADSGMPMTGLSALLVIFAVLCLTTFAVLSMATVNADRNLADRAVSQTAAWYEADGEAEKILAGIRRGEIPDTVREAGTDEEGRTIYEYTCLLSGTQALEVRAAVKEDEYEILRWQLVSTADWAADEDLSVWDGE